MSLLGLIRGYRSSDDTAQPLRLDKATNTLQTIEYEHHEIHGGSMFSVSYKEDMALNATFSVVAIVPNTTKWPHFTFVIENESEIDFNLWEDATISDNGTAITTYNRDRNSSTTAGLLWFHTPAGITTGTTAILTWHSGAGRGEGGNNIRTENEFILKQNTKYILQVAAIAAGYVAIRASWYEHTNIA